MTKVIALVCVQTLTAKAEFHSDGRLLRAAHVDTHMPGSIFDLAKAEVEAMVSAGHVRLPLENERPSRPKPESGSEKLDAISDAEKALAEAQALLADSGDDLVAKGEAEAMVTAAEAALAALKA